MPVKEVPSSSLIRIFPENSPIRLKYKDIFEIEEFYKALHEWLIEYEWADAEEGSDHYETYYGEKIDRNGLREIWIWWRPQRKAKEGNFKYYLDFNFHFLGITTIEIVKEGRKIKAYKGEVELTIKALMEATYISFFDKDPTLKLLKEFVLEPFSKRTYRKEVEERKKELYQEVYVLQNFIKQWFKMKRYLPYEEAKGFFPSYAWPSHFKE